MTLPICIRFNKEQKIDNADFYIVQNDLADFVSDFNKEQELTMPIFISRKNDLADFYIGMTIYLKKRISDSLAIRAIKSP